MTPKSTAQQALNGLVQLMRVGKSIWLSWVKQDKENYFDSSSGTTVPITLNNIAYKQTLDYMITQSINTMYKLWWHISAMRHRDNLIDLSG